MKYLKKFNEVKAYTEEDLVNFNIRDRKNYKTVINHLKGMWQYPDDVITAVVVAFGGSYDESEEYLSDMDGFGYDDPAEYWPEWCEHHRIGHEIDNNPFI